jgi:hypothetical protein
MILKHRIFAITLLVVMVFTIGRYQIPYIQYNLFKDYIAKNLCVNREMKDNDCQGKCFLKKQIKATDENNNVGENNTKKKVQKTEGEDFLYSSVSIPDPIEIVNLSIAVTVKVKTLRFKNVIFVPPKSTTFFKLRLFYLLHTT